MVIYMGKHVVDIAEYGAIGDGYSINTAVIQKAIDDCSRAGGGTVLIAEGVFLCGTIFLKSNVMLEVDATAVLMASPDISDYCENTHHNRYCNEPDMDRCFIYAENQENIGLCGMGKIIGNAECFPHKESRILKEEIWIQEETGRCRSTKCGQMRF